MPESEVAVAVDGRRLRLSNLEKVLWPDTGFTKGELIDYYQAVAPVMAPHLAGRALTLRRFPNGVTGQSFFEKNAPSHRPPWMGVVHMDEIDYCEVSDRAGLVWLANLAAIELHPTLARAPDFQRPDYVVFDLDPGPGADLGTCIQVACWLRGHLERLGLQSWAKTSGSKGLQLYVPFDHGPTYEQTRPFAHRLAQLLEAEHPDVVVSTQNRAARTNRVLIDWSQNTAFKTTVAVYSVRARERPTVSMPVSWDELEEALEAKRCDHLVWDAPAARARIDERGDLMAPLLHAQQPWPSKVEV